MAGQPRAGCRPGAARLASRRADEASPSVYRDGDLRLIEEHDAHYMEWDRTVLEYCWDRIDYLSAHRYSGNRHDDSAWYLAEGVEIDRVLADYAGLLDRVRGLKCSSKRV